MAEAQDERMTLSWMVMPDTSLAIFAQEKIAGERIENEAGGPPHADGTTHRCGAPVERRETLRRPPPGSIRATSRDDHLGSRLTRDRRPG